MEANAALFGEYGNEVDYAAVLTVQHAASDLLGEEEGGAEVAGVEFFPFIAGDRVDRAGEEAAGVVDEDVYGHVHLIKGGHGRGEV